MRSSLALIALALLATAAPAEDRPATIPAGKTLPRKIYPTDLAVREAASIYDALYAPTYSERIRSTLAAYGPITPAEEEPARTPGRTISGDYVALIPAHPARDFHMIPSPNYRRLAFTESFEKNRWCVVVDDHAWEFYDLVDAPSLQFSPDSKHLACAALRDGEWRIVIDNTEFKAPLPRKPSEVRWTPDGGSIAYIARGDKTARAVVPEKSQPEFDDVQHLVFSADSAHFAYIATRAGKTQIITDTAAFDTAEVLAPPVFTADGKHIRDLAEARDATGSGVALLEDGKPVTRWPLAGKFRRASLSPDGQHAAIIDTADVAGHFERIKIDGEELPIHYLSIERLTWSPAGKIAFVGTHTPIAGAAAVLKVSDIAPEGRVQYAVVGGVQDAQPYRQITSALVFTSGKQLEFQAVEVPVPYEEPLAPPPVRPWNESPRIKCKWNLGAKSSGEVQRWNELDAGYSGTTTNVISAYHTDTPWGDVISAKADGSHKTHLLVVTPASISVNQKELYEVKLYAIEREPAK